jgi:hypothetical protein
MGGLVMRNGLQWYRAAPGLRIRRHSFVGLDAEGLLHPLAPGLLFAGVAEAALFTRGGRRCPVRAQGEVWARLAPGSGPPVPGSTAWLAGSERVTDVPPEEDAVPVGRFVGMGPRGRVRVLITPFAMSG